MGRPPKVRTKYDIKFHHIVEWYDDLTRLTTGVAFIWKITSPDAPAGSAFYYVADLHLPPKPSHNVKNATAVWFSGEGTILGDTKEGAMWWRRVLESEVGVDVRDPKRRKTQSALSNLASYDIYFKNEDEKELVRDVSTKSEEDFLADFEEDVQKLIKADRVHHLVGKSPAEIYAMVPLDKILEAYEKLEGILENLMGHEEEEDIPAEEPDEEEELPEFGAEEPTEEELAAIEAEKAAKRKK